MAIKTLSNPSKARTAKSAKTGAGTGGAAVLGNRINIAGGVANVVAYLFAPADLSLFGILQTRMPLSTWYALGNTLINGKSSLVVIPLLEQEIPATVIETHLNNPDQKTFPVMAAAA